MQIITKDKKVYCVAKVHYPKEIIAKLKKAGYKVKEVEDNG